MARAIVVAIGMGIAPVGLGAKGEGGHLAEARLQREGFLQAVVAHGRTLPVEQIDSVQIVPESGG